MKFTLQEIVKATRKFSPSWKIGQGGFGTVYNGRLDDGTLVAVKRAKKIFMITISKSLGYVWFLFLKTLRCYLNLLIFL